MAYIEPHPTDKKKHRIRWTDHQNGVRACETFVGTKKEAEKECQYWTRKEQERSIAFLARKCGITRAYMHKMIHGKRNFSELYKQKCASVLRIKYKELFDA